MVNVKKVKNENLSLTLVKVVLAVCLVQTALGSIRLSAFSPLHKSKISLLKTDRIWYPMSDFYSVYSAKDAKFEAQKNA